RRSTWWRCSYPGPRRGRWRRRSGSSGGPSRTTRGTSRSSTTWRSSSSGSGGPPTPCRTPRLPWPSARGARPRGMAGPGPWPGAVAEYQEAVRAAPGWAEAHNKLAWILAVGPDRLRDGRRAVRLATRACELTEWTDAGTIDTLAAAYAEAGDFARAAEYQRKA